MLSTSDDAGFSSLNRKFSTIYKFLLGILSSTQFSSLPVLCKLSLQIELATCAPFNILMVILLEIYLLVELDGNFDDFMKEMSFHGIFSFIK